MSHLDKLSLSVGIKILLLNRLQKGILPSVKDFADYDIKLH